MSHDHAMGWVPDLPDVRDYSLQTPNIAAALSRTQLGKKIKAKSSKLPATTDLREWCSPIEDQKSLGSCTANAGVGLVEYYERRACGKHLDASRLFLYKVTRNLVNWTGDTGAYLRTTAHALTLFGVPPEQYWPYKIADFDVEPTAFCYAFAQNYQSINFVRLDMPGIGKDLLSTIKTSISGGFPAMFGFTCYSSIDDAEVGRTGTIPYPKQGEKAVGGHAVIAVGYDDGKVIAHPNGGAKTKGAILIRNSWGTAWGEQGYGWLPYAYIESELALDW
jgi:C1A family cysteine protease